MSFILFVYRMNMPSSLSLFSIVFFFITPFNLLLFLCVSSKFPPILYIYIYIFQPSAQTYGQSSSSFLTSMDQSITISFILHFFFERTQKGWRGQFSNLCLLEMHRKDNMRVHQVDMPRYWKWGGCRRGLCKKRSGLPCAGHRLFQEHKTHQVSEQIFPASRLKGNSGEIERNMRKEKQKETSMCWL